jgi:nitronate monooxygenase/enoyl-[acyl-carrier protein] reductase II
MIHTPLCDLLEIDHPIIQAGMGAVPSAALVAAVSNAGALGTFSTFTRPVDDTRRQLATLRDLTDRPFAVNHVVQAVDEESFRLALEAEPKLVSMALADPGDFVARVHDAGALFMQQVTTVAQAVEAAERGVDLIVAQGGESGGFGGDLASMSLVPQVVDAVTPLPVVAAGGVFDGRGLAAALMLGAVGVNVGTRFLASTESAAHGDYKAAVTKAVSQDAVKAEFFNEVVPAGASGYGTTVRALRTPFVERWRLASDRSEEDTAELTAEFVAAAQDGRSHEFIAAAGESSGGITEVLPAADIVRLIMEEAEATLNDAPQVS